MFLTILEESCVQKESCSSYQEAFFLVRKVLLWGVTLGLLTKIVLAKTKMCFQCLKWLQLNQRSHWDSMHNTGSAGFLLSHSSALWHKEMIGICQYSHGSSFCSVRASLTAGKRLWPASGLNPAFCWTISPHECLLCWLCSHKNKKCYFLLVLIVKDWILIQSWHQKSIISVSLVEVGGVHTSVVCPYLHPSLPAIGLTFTQVANGELGDPLIGDTCTTQQCCLPSLHAD